MNDEIWRQHGDLEFSNLARVRVPETGEILTPKADQFGLLRVWYQGCQYFLHIVVHALFVNSEKQKRTLRISFRDGNPLNCEAENLFLEKAHLRKRRATNRGALQLSDGKWATLRGMHAAGYSAEQIASAMNLNVGKVAATVATFW